MSKKKLTGPPKLKALPGGKGKSKKPEVQNPQKKANKSDPIRITAEVKVKVDKDCGLPEAARMVLADHAGEMLTALLSTLDRGQDVTSKYLIVKTTAIRVKDWDILDLRPKGTSPQEELPGT